MSGYVKTGGFEEWFIEISRENQLDVPTLNKALADYYRTRAEELFFDVLADPENTAANEERYQKIEEAPRALEQIN